MLTPFGHLDGKRFTLYSLCALAIILVSAFIRLYTNHGYFHYSQILGLIGFYSAFCVFFRRFHTIGKSAWSILALLISCFIISVIVMMFVSILYALFQLEIYQNIKEVKQGIHTLSKPMRLSMIFANMFVYFAFVVWLARFKIKNQDLNSQKKNNILKQDYEDNKLE